MSRSEMELPASGIDDVAFSPASPALSVSENVYLPVAARKAWDVIKDFDNWQSWHPAVAGTEISAGRGNEVGAVRILATHDGKQFTEELLSYDAASRSYRYSIVDSPLPVTGYVARIEVRGDAQVSTVDWSSTFRLAPGATEAEARQAIVGIYRAGLNRLASMLK